jgi:hypothetical protein
MNQRARAERTRSSSPVPAGHRNEVCMLGGQLLEFSMTVWVMDTTGAGAVTVRTRTAAPRQYKTGSWKERDVPLVAETVATGVGRTTTFLTVLTMFLTDRAGKELSKKPRK